MNKYLSSKAEVASNTLTMDRQSWQPSSVAAAIKECEFEFLEITWWLSRILQ